MGLILLVILFAIVLWIIGAYNKLISLKNQVVNAWKQIDVQLKRRHDLIPNLVNTVKGAMDFERSTLEAVIAARNKAVGATGVAQVAKAEGELSQALGRFFALSENYPQLKATENVKQLQEELTSTENKIGFARQLYNDVATEFNTKQMQFPTNLVAGLAKAEPAELWEIEDAGERAVPQVDLSTQRPGQ
ncbi:MAG TPA: LemA family protein [Gemmatimonadales bacterium]|jgi:LemA protein|nr:LemA family protein [Gemmatimonadales bacterium]